MEAETKENKTKRQEKEGMGDSYTRTLLDNKEDIVSQAIFEERVNSRYCDQIRYLYNPGCVCGGGVGECWYIYDPFSRAKMYLCTTMPSYNSGG